MKWVVIIILAAILFANHSLNSAYRTLPIEELKRRARSGKDKKAAAVYRAAAYQEGLQILLWLVGSISAAFLILVAANIGWWLAASLILLMGMTVFIGRQARYPEGHRWRIAALLAPVAAKVLSLLQPIFSRAERPIQANHKKRTHTGLYEKEDLIELLKVQSKQQDSRFSDTELAVIKNALSFGEKSVNRVMLPRKDLKIIAASDTIGPLLMDDLHKTSQVRFLVTKTTSKAANPEIVGNLNLKELLRQLDRGGNVGEIMHPGVGYINESHSLSQALDAFIKTHQHILVVVNNFEEMVGAVTIEQVAAQLLGDKINDEFDNYDDLSSVAGLEPQKTDKNHNEINIAPKQK